MTVYARATYLFQACSGLSGETLRRSESFIICISRRRRNNRGWLRVV
jgi:hypothetical protein